MHDVEKRLRGGWQAIFLNCTPSQSVLWFAGSLEAVTSVCVCRVCRTDGKEGTPKAPKLESQGLVP